MIRLEVKLAPGWPASPAMGDAEALAAAFRRFGKAVEIGKLTDESGGKWFFVSPAGGFRGVGRSWEEAFGRTLAADLAKGVRRKVHRRLVRGLGFGLALGALLAMLSPGFERWAVGLALFAYAAEGVACSL